GTTAQRGQPLAYRAAARSRSTPQRVARDASQASTSPNSCRSAAGSSSRKARESSPTSSTIQRNVASRPRPASRSRYVRRRMSCNSPRCIGKVYTVHAARGKPGGSAGVEDAADDRQAWQREQRVGGNDGAVVPVDSQSTGEVRRGAHGRSTQPELAVDLGHGPGMQPPTPASDDDTAEVERPGDVQHAVDDEQPLPVDAAGQHEIAAREREGNGRGLAGGERCERSGGNQPRATDEVHERRRRAGDGRRGTGRDDE